MEAIPGEVNHLSTLRKRNQSRDSLSSGERTGSSPNLVRVKRYGVAHAGVVRYIRGGAYSLSAQLTSIRLGEGDLESATRDGDSPVSENRDACVGYSLEYGGTRETLLETGRTTFQGSIRDSYR